MYTSSKTKTVSLRGGSKISLFSKGWAELDKLVPFYQHHSHEEHFSHGCNYNIDILTHTDNHLAVQDSLG